MIKPIKGEKKLMEKIEEGEGLMILIDSSALKSMFDGKDEHGKPSTELSKKLKELKDSGKDILCKIPMSHFLRAIFLADPNTPIKEVQKVLSFSQIIPSFADFKDKDACMNEMIEIAKIIRKHQEESK